MLRSALLLLIGLSTVQLGALRPALALPDVDRERLAAYLDRLSAVPPRDAEAHAALARWCSEQGLAAEAKQAYEKAISIDADCAAARAALGYVRYGTGWRLRGAAGREAKAGPRGEPDVEPGSRTGPGPASADAERSAASTRTEVRVVNEQPPTGVAGIAAAASRVEEKKNWAAEASDRFGLAFATYEDRDFLVHSTFSKKDRDFKALVNRLKNLRRIVASVLGVRSRTVIWPDKLQIVLLRSEPEYDRFALNIDGIQSARNPRGSYTKDDHTVLWKPDGEAVARAVGGTALAQLYDSDRPVGRWLELGVEEMVVAGSPWGAERKYVGQAFVDAARVLREDSEGDLIFKLLEIRERRATDRNAALAMTLTQFLVKRSRRGFTEFVRELKSNEAPARPESPDGHDAYLLSFVAFQEKAVKSHFGASVQLLGEKWKEYVVRTGGKLEEEMEKERKEAELKERRARSRGRYR